MASTESLVYSALTSYEPLSALIAGRVYPMVIPSGDADAALPAITFMRVSTDPVTDIDSGLQTIDHARIQVDCWAVSKAGVYSGYAMVKDVSAAAKEAMASATASMRSVILGEQDMYEDEYGIYRVSMDFSVWNTTEG